MKALVTGAGGFIGSHLAEALVSEGYEVRALCKYNSLSSHGWLEQSVFSDDIDIRLGDVRDGEQVDALVKDIDIIFNLAALIGIPYSYEAPQSYISTNVMGSLNLLNAARRYGVEKFIQTSTSEVYGTARYVPINEAHPLQPQSPYSASKISSDCLALSYFHSFGLPVTIARPFNTYGPRQSARALIPTVISQMLSGEREIRLGSLHPTRDLNYVTDTCRGFICLAASGTAGETYNIGSNTEFSVGDVAYMISHIIGKDITIVSDSARIRPDSSEVERLVCDSSLITSKTGYQPLISLKQGLRSTVEWMSSPAIMAKYKPRTYCV
jgi:NAD dependent epimerase/dehydratase